MAERKTTPRSKRKHKSKTDAAAIIRAERKARILELRKAGVTYRAISHEVGVSPGECHKLADEAIADIYREKAAAEVALQLDRSDTLFATAYAIARSQDRYDERTTVDDKGRTVVVKTIVTGASADLKLKAIDRCIAVQQRRARMLGTDAPEKVVHGLGSNFDEWTDADLREYLKTGKRPPEGT